MKGSLLELTHSGGASHMQLDSKNKSDACFVPGVERPDALLLADPEEGVEHASVAHLRVLGLTLDLQPSLRQVDGKRS